MLTRESPHNSGIFCPGFWLLCHSSTRREPRDTNLPRDFHRKFLARQARYPPEGIRSRRFSAAHQAESERRERRRRREDRRVLRDADRRWIPSLRRDRETFYESFYERLYEPRTELGPRLRFCYTRAATAMSLSPPPPPETPRGPLRAGPPLLSLSFPLLSIGTRFLYRSSKVPRFSSSSYPVVDILVDYRVLLVSMLSLSLPLPLPLSLLLLSLLSALLTRGSPVFLKTRLSRRLRRRKKEGGGAGSARKESRARSIDFPRKRPDVFLRRALVRSLAPFAALTSASGSIGSPQLFCSPIKF